MAAALVIPAATPAADALAATGTLTFNGHGVVEQKTSNISGPLSFTSGANDTASFTSLTNTGGSLTVFITPSGGYEPLCTASFTTAVVNGRCLVSVNNAPGGQDSVCSSSLLSSNPATCDFSATFTVGSDIPVGGPPPH